MISTPVQTYGYCYLWTIQTKKHLLDMFLVSPFWIRYYPDSSCPLVCHLESSLPRKQGAADACLVQEEVRGRIPYQQESLHPLCIVKMHAWYKKKFAGEYPAQRKAFIPYVLWRRRPGTNRSLQANTLPKEKPSFLVSCNSSRQNCNAHSVILRSI